MLSLDKFVQLVERSKLVDSDHLSRVITDWKREATLRQLDQALPCAEHLVELGVLTEWQSKKLLEGRHRGFFLGKYKLLDHLGTGGMSSVYLAEHLLMQRRVAIKVLPQNRVSDSSYLARFHLEAQAAAALDHRNIVRAYDIDNQDKVHYLVMEYVEGHDLDELVVEHGPLDYYTAAEYIAQAATGLEHAHGCGLIHRDVKPANLLVDLRGTVKILDMGLAKFTSQTRPAPGFAKDEHVLGTADYLAPEQAVNSQLVDARADIYALGCTLYFLLTGHPPFPQGTSQERMTAHQQRMPPSVLVDRPDAPPALVAICLRMMEKSPANRYQSAGEVHQALHAWLESETALGRTTRAAVAARPRGGAGAPVVRYRGPSRTDLVSGSATDLPDLPLDPARAARGLQDTDLNLQRATVKIPSVSRQRDPAAAVAPTIAPPPIATDSTAPGSSSPPSPSQIITVAPPVQLPEAVFQSASEPPANASVRVSQAAPQEWMAHPRKPVRSSNGLLLMVIGALIAVTALLVLALV